MSSISAATQGLITAYKFAVPQGGDKVYKDECVYCYGAQVINFLTVKKWVSFFTISLYYNELEGPSLNLCKLSLSFFE